MDGTAFAAPNQNILTSKLCEELGAGVSGVGAADSVPDGRGTSFVCYKLRHVLNEHKGTSANLPRALVGALTLELELIKHNILSFRWPQDVDSGIDLVSFVVSPRADKAHVPLATSFVAGFQSKATAKSFMPDQPNEDEQLTAYELQVRSEPREQTVDVDGHEAYWTSSSLPVFAACIDGNGLVLVEDTLSFLDANRGATQILMTKQLHEVASDIRLRMFAHALAPWFSAALRRYRLGAGPQGADSINIWSLLTNEMQHGSSPQTWSEVSQWFTLVDYLSQDEPSQEEMRASFDISVSRNNSFKVGYRILHQLIDMNLEFFEQRATAPIAGATAMLGDLRASFDVVERMWKQALDCTGWTAETLAAEVLLLHEDVKSVAPSRLVLKRIEQGEPVQSALANERANWLQDLHDNGDLPF